MFAPARVNLIGEHTDYTGGLVLPVAVDVGTTVTWRPREDGVRVRSQAFRDTVDIAADGSSEVDSGWGRYVAAVVRLLREHGRPAIGLNAEIASTVPIGAGLSSSAALTVSIGRALCEAAAFAVDPLELARLCRRAELLAVGVPCGLMDPAASLLGRRGHALLLDCRTEEYRYVALPDDVAIVVVDSGVRHSLESSGYAARRDEVERAVAGATDAVAQRRLHHVVTENERVRRVVLELERRDGPDLAALGELFRDAHASLRDDFEVSTPELDLLVDLAYEHGAIAARMTGGGFGGSIVALSQVEEAPALCDAVADDYRRRSNREANGYVLASVDGAAMQ